MLLSAHVKDGLQGQEYDLLQNAMRYGWSGLRHPDLRAKRGTERYGNGLREAQERHTGGSGKRGRGDAKGICTVQRK